MKEEVLPFPFEPATWIALSFFCGLSKRSKNFVILSKPNFTPKRHLKAGKRIRPDLLDHFDPELKEFAEHGIVYGIIEDAELISVCPVPFIYQEADLSFAIIHNIYTNEKTIISTNMADENKPQEAESAEQKPAEAPVTPIFPWKS